jgi:hypothetical protein
MRPSVLAALACACGTSSQPSRTLPDLCAQILTANCAWEVECHFAPSDAACEGVFGYPDLDCDDVRAAAAAGKLTYDLDAGVRCLAQLESRDCVTNMQPDPAGEPCLDAFVGQVPEGATCFIDQECVNRRYVQDDHSCDARTQCCPGTCTRRVQGPAGSACTSSFDCDDELYCPSKTHACTSLLAGGMTCDELDACRDPFACNVPNPGGFGTCVVPGAHGGACSPDSAVQCGDLRDYCDVTTSRCTFRSKAGEPCETLGVDQPSCEFDTRCNKTTRQCVALVGFGETCGDDFDCLLARCIDHKCTPYPAPPTCE